MTDDVQFEIYSEVINKGFRSCKQHHNRTGLQRLSKAVTKNFRPEDGFSLTNILLGSNLESEK